MSGRDGRELHGKSLLINNSFLITEQKSSKGRAKISTVTVTLCAKKKTNPFKELKCSPTYLD